MENHTAILTDLSATVRTKHLYDFLLSLKGKGILSGQQECPCDKTHGDELAHIKECSGHLPAILGLDYIEHDYEGVNKRAREWFDRGGIVSICWHWGIPPYGVGYPSSQESVDMVELLTPGTPLYEGLLSNLDVVANALKELQDADIPVLFRPLHEFDGAWFWWGKGGSENFKKLWVMMYDRYTNYWGLDNLIWVLGYSGNGNGYADWYPGDAYVDIAGADSYNDGSNAALYNKVKDVVGEERPICFHECGRIPTVDQLTTTNAGWVWFMTWHTEHITDHNDTDTLNEIYNDDYVITLDELPDLYNTKENTAAEK